MNDIKTNLTGDELELVFKYRREAQRNPNYVLWNFDDNMEKVLKLLEKKTNRSASFRTVIALIKDGQTSSFEGKIEGSIAMQPRGESGFGYDPIFIPTDYLVSFAQLTADEKNSISHRALAVQKLVEYLQKKNKPFN